MAFRTHRRNELQKHRKKKRIGQIVKQLNRIARTFNIPLPEPKAHSFPYDPRRAWNSGDRA